MIDITIFKLPQNITQNFGLIQARNDKNLYVSTRNYLSSAYVFKQTSQVDQAIFTDIVVLWLFKVFPYYIYIHYTIYMHNAYMTYPYVVLHVFVVIYFNNFTDLFL